MRLSAPAVREIVARFDTDGDDQVDFSEFVAFFFHQKDTAEAPSRNGNNSRGTGPSGSAVDRLGGSGGISGQDLSQVISVEQELRAFFDLFTGRNKASIANENKIICAVVNFAMEVFVGHAGWRYSVRRDRWELAELCLDTMCQILSPENTPVALAKSGAFRAGSVSEFSEVEEDARSVLMEALLEDRGLQHCLMTVLTMLASTAFKPTSSADDNKGDDARREGGLLPVDFAQGLHRPNFLSVSEIEDIERMVCRAFDLVILVLEEPVGGVGRDSLFESPSDRIENAQSKLNLVSFNLQIPKRDNSTATAIECKANAVVAIASFVQYAPFAKQSRGTTSKALARD